MNDGITDLSVLHDVPYEDVEGAYVKVEQEITEQPFPLTEEPKRSIETREGYLVGRGNGRGVSYDTAEKATTPITIGPSIYLDTPEDTILEVRTDKTENELLEFEAQE